MAEAPLGWTLAEGKWYRPQFILPVASTLLFAPILRATTIGVSPRSILHLRMRSPRVMGSKVTLQSGPVGGRSGSIAEMQCRDAD